MALNPGDTVGRYVIEEKIGEGGMGAVYKANQPAIRRQVVLKVLSTGLAGNREMLDRFQREVDMIAQLEHPHILPVYDFGEYAGEPYIVMRYLPGGTLYDLMRARTADRSQIMQVLGQVAAALDYAHDRGVVHRDLKPANIMLDEAGNAYLGDFGLAKTVEGGHDLTATGTILGTPAYMSPEQIRGVKLDRRSDIYSFAVVAYEALSGRRPFVADDAYDYLELHLVADPEPITSINPSLGSAVAAIFQSALAKSPQARPARASELMETIGTALGREVGAGAAAGATIVGGPGRARPPAAPPRWLWLLLLLPLAVVAIAIVGGGGLWLGSRAGLFDARPETYAVGDSPRALAFAGQSIWVAHALDQTVARLDTEGCGQASSDCGKALATIPVDDLPVALTFDGQRLWVAGALSGSLLALDPISGEKLGTIDVPNIPSNMIFAAGNLWTANGFAASISRVDPDSGDSQEFTVDEGPLGLAFDGANLWVTHEEAGTLLRLDPDDGSILDRYRLDGSLMGIVFDGSNLWVALPDQNQVVAVDRLNGAVIQRAEVGERPVALFFDGERLWAANQGGDSISQIDPVSGSEVRQVQVPSGPWALASSTCGQGCEDLWIASEAVDTVSRLRLSP